MRKLIILSFLLLSNAIALQAQEPVGIWLTEKKEAKVEIYQTSTGDYEGKIIWTKDQTEDSKRTIGQRILSTFKKKSKNTYEHGTINHLQQKKKYSGIITMISPNILKLRGYIGNPLFGISQTWTKVEE
ncbi:MAG TPA: DUF2147 domain-containing protein [Edaphocola sp.]|nr:DUF2147 domain-containing protein [Edaphocola sp.]